MRRTVLVAGASGLVGGSVAAHLASTGRFRVVTLSRRGAQVEPALHVAADLLDPGGSWVREPVVRTVSDVVFAAYQPAADPVEEVRVNLAMLTNLVEGLQSAGAPVRHVTLIQGGKAYGSHLGPFPTPARETDPRIAAPLFYYAQQDFLAGWAVGGRRCTVFRPNFPLGFALGNPINLMVAVGAYAAVSAELGDELVFPGSPRSFDAINQATDGGLLARGIEWGMRGVHSFEIFNISNGDQFRWSRLWPRVAELFGLRPVVPAAFSLSAWAEESSRTWDELIERHDLLMPRLGDLVDWRASEVAFTREYDLLTSTSRLRAAGFTEYLDTEERVLEILGVMAAERRLPPLARSGLL